MIYLCVMLYMLGMVPVKEGIEAAEELGLISRPGPAFKLLTVTLWPLLAMCASALRAYRYVIGSKS